MAWAFAGFAASAGGATGGGMLAAGVDAGFTSGAGALFGGSALATTSGLRGSGFGNSAFADGTAGAATLGSARGAAPAAFGPNSSFTMASFRCPGVVVFSGFTARS